jgi:phosphatidylglycerol:prolipoprotein diacylglycerol transferase
VNGRAYKVMLYLGCVAGVYAGAAVAVERGLGASRFALVTIALLIPAFVGARALFVVQHLDAYRDARLRIAARTEGGAGLFGGLAVATAVSVPVLHVAALPFWTFWDAAAVTMLVGLLVTRFGCLMNGCCAGRPTASWLGIQLSNVTGHRARRYPTQLMEACLAAVVLIAALAVRNSVPDGVLFIGVVAVYCAGRAALQPLREDPALWMLQRPQARTTRRLARPLD